LLGELVQALCSNLPKELLDVDDEGHRENKRIQKILAFQAKAGVQLRQVWERPPIDKVAVENFSSNARNELSQQ
jgi:hypothetical protein